MFRISSVTIAFFVFTLVINVVSNVQAVVEIEIFPASTQGIILDKRLIQGDESHLNEESNDNIFNVYLVENDEGWIISCSCIEMAFINHKPIFERIIDSFRRI